MLNQEEFAEFCMIMRVVDFMQSRRAIFDEDPEVIAAFEELQCCTASLFELLDADERDALLDRYREEQVFLDGASR